jgi:long-chain acyl-CoA synthetase
MNARTMASTLGMFGRAARRISFSLSRRSRLSTSALGFVDARGFLFVVDRKKDMILSGGQNIYPADIQQVMHRHPAVADVAVVAARSGKWGETPVAIVVVHDGAGVERQELMNWTNARVGKRQRIADIFWHSALPRNPAGKVLKRQLRSEISDREY